MKKRFLICALAAALPCMATSASAQARLNQNELLRSLDVLDNGKVLDVNALRQKAIDSVATNRDPDPLDRGPLSDELDRLAQFTVQILFQVDSAAVHSDSFRTLGVIADALHEPSLQEYKFVVVGHTDASGSRRYNLDLSQKRAEAIRNALVTTFRIQPDRISAIGLGEEQLRDRAHPDSAVNRRVQLINLGRYRK